MIYSSSIMEWYMISLQGITKMVDGGGWGIIQVHMSSNNLILVINSSNNLKMVQRYLQIIFIVCSFPMVSYDE